MTDEIPRVGASAPTVTAKGVRGIVLYAVAHGVSRDAILQHAGIEVDTLNDPDGRLLRHQVMAVWEFVATELRDPAVALSVTQALPYGMYDVLDYAFATSPTVAAGVEVVRRYFRLFLDRAELDVERSGDETVFRYRMLDDDEGLERYSAEFTFGILTSRLRHCAEHDNPDPAWVTFAHETEADPAVYRDWFGCSVRFGMGANLLAVPHSLFDARMRTADPGLNGVLRRHADVLLEQFPELDALDSVVRRELFAMFTGGDTQPNIDDVGKRLGMSGRTLQRRLAEIDTNYARLLDDTRHELAIRFLGDRSVSISEIGFLLGFSEASAFHRAFRRWSGRTPGSYRREMLGDAP